MQKVCLCPILPGVKGTGKAANKCLNENPVQARFWIADFGFKRENNVRALIISVQNWKTIFRGFRSGTN
jgi:hypothetical protein